MRRAQLLVVSLLVAVVASRALAQPAPTFSQTYNYPDGVTPSFNVITATRTFESAAFDTATTFSTTLPFTFDCSGSVSTELHYSGSSLHWELDLGHGGGCTNSFTSALECDPAFRLYGLGLAESATLRVRAVAKVAIVDDGFNGLFRGRVAIFGTTARDSLDVLHSMNGTPTTTIDTLEVAVLVHGDSQLFSFHLNVVNHVDFSDDPYQERQEIDADVYFLDVPPGMVVANAYGYGADELSVPLGTGHRSRLMARARADGRAVVLSGVASGAAGADVGLFDVTGRRLAGGHAAPSASGEVQLALPDALKSGLYFVRCADAGGVHSARFVFAR